MDETCNTGNPTVNSLLNYFDVAKLLLCQLNLNNTATSESNGTGNHTKEDVLRCIAKETVIERFFFLAMDAMSIIFIVILMFQRKRVRLWPHFCGGKPSIAIPYDSFDNFVRRGGPVAAYCVLSYIFYKILNQTLPIDFVLPKWLTVVRYLVNVMVFGIAFFPLFAGITAGGYFGFGIAIYYALIYGLYILVFPLKCKPTKDSTMDLVYHIPVYIASIVLVAMNSYYLIRHILNKVKVSTYNAEQEAKYGFLPSEDHRISYVKSLIKRKDINDEEKPNLFRRFYPKHEGFRYSALMLSITSVCILILYFCIVYVVYQIVELWNGLKQFEDLVAEIRKQYAPDLPDGAKVYIAFLVDIFETVVYFLQVTLAITIVDVILSAVLVAGNLLFTLLSYRRNMIQLYKGPCNEIRPRETISSNAYYLVATVKYGGYQIAYMFWAFLMLNILLGGIIAILANVIIAMKDIEYIRNLVLYFLMDKWLAIVLTMVIYYMQIIICKFFFLQERGKNLAINNRRVFFVFAYFMVFFNVFVGFFSALLRILKGAFVGTLLLPRLDKSLMPKVAESKDAGHASYCGLLYTEVMHTHPILFVFANTLLASIGKKEETQTLEINWDNEKEQINIADQKALRRKRARTRWFLAYTLYHNLPMRMYRSDYLNKMNKKSDNNKDEKEKVDSDNESFQEEQKTQF